MNKECKLPGCKKVFNARRSNQEYCSKGHRDEARKNRSRQIRVTIELYRRVKRIKARSRGPEKHGFPASRIRSAINPNGFSWRAVMLFLVDRNLRLVLRLAARLGGVEQSLNNFTRAVKK